MNWQKVDAGHLNANTRSVKLPIPAAVRTNTLLLALLVALPLRADQTKYKQDLMDSPTAVPKA